MKDLPLLLKALAFAAHKHRDQRRKDAGASPYINHPIALADVLVNEAGVTDIEVLCAALLHDTVEDTATTHEELVNAFGSRIARVVAEVTDDQALPKAERKRLQVERAAGLSAEAKLVKLADKICNLRDVVERPPASWDAGRRLEYFDWAKNVVDGLRGDPAAEMRRLEKAFDAAYDRKPG
jgi:guanosine-3',5'-bis(diphosphate) 3'-pyrophosphohydrolase